MKDYRIIGFVLLLFSWLSAVSAMEVDGVVFDQSMSLEEGGEQLRLNGAGIRKKFFVSIYAAALYLPLQSTDAQTIIEQDTPSRVVMHMVYSEVGRDKIIAGWNEGFEANHDKQQLKALQSRLEQFNGLFSDLKKGDLIYLDYLPGEGTRVSLNGELRGVVPGRDFKSALLSVWLDKAPVTKRLKSALLGED